MNEEIAAKVRLTSELARCIRNWFHENGFFELRIPTLRPTPNPGLSASSPPPLLLERSSLALSSGDLPLAAYSQLAVLERVYTMAPCFRPEEGSDASHLDEYTYIHAMFRGSAQAARALCISLIEHALSVSLDQKSLTNQRRDELERQCVGSFVERSYVNVLSEHERSFSGDLSREQELEIVREAGGVPTLLLNSPVGFKPNFADCKVREGRLEDFEILFPFAGEVASGGQYETDRSKLRRQLAVASEDGSEQTDFDQYIEALSSLDGSDISFFGLGFERLVQFVLGSNYISDSVVFNYSPITKLTHEGSTMGK